MADGKQKPINPSVGAAPLSMPAEEGTVTIDLVELFYRLIEKIKYIIGGAFVGALLALLITVYAITPLYTTTAKLYVLNANDSAISLSDFQIGTYLTNDYREVFNIWHVHERVLEQLRLPYSYRQLSSMVQVTNPNNTRILSITATAPDPKQAKDIADTYAQVAKEFIAKAMETREPNIIEEALLPSSPSSPSKIRNVMLGFIAGVIVSAGLIVLRFVVDDRIRTADEISRYLDLPTLGMVPLQGSKTKSRNNRAKSKKREGTR